MPVSRLSSRRRKSSHGLSGVYTPAKPGIYGAPALPLYNPALADKYNQHSPSTTTISLSSNPTSSSRPTDPTPALRAISFAPNVTPVSFTSSEEAQAQAKADEEAAALLARVRAMPDGTGDLLANDAHSLASGVYASSLAQDGSSSVGGDDPASLFAAGASAGTVGQKTSRRKRQPPGKRLSQGYIPRPPNAFMLFRADFVRQKHVPGTIEQNHGSLSKIIANIWHELPIKEQEVWKARARAEKAAHKAMFPQYKFKPVHKKGKNAAAAATAASKKKGKKNPSDEEDDDEDSTEEGEDAGDFFPSVQTQTSSRGHSVALSHSHPRAAAHPYHQRHTSRAHHAHQSRQQHGAQAPTQPKSQAQIALDAHNAKHENDKADRERYLNARSNQREVDRNAYLSQLFGDGMDGEPVREAIKIWDDNRDKWEREQDKLQNWGQVIDDYERERNRLMALLDEENWVDVETASLVEESTKSANHANVPVLRMPLHGHGHYNLVPGVESAPVQGGFYAPQPTYAHFAPFQPQMHMQQNMGNFMRRPSSVPALPSDFNFAQFNTEGFANANFANTHNNVAQVNANGLAPTSMAPLLGPPGTSPSAPDVGISTMFRQQQSGWFTQAGGDAAAAEEELDQVSETFTNPFASSSNTTTNEHAVVKVEDAASSKAANNLATFNARMSFSMPPGAGSAAGYLGVPRMSFSNNRMSFSNGASSRMSFSNGAGGPRMSFSNMRLSFSNPRMSFSMHNGPRMSFSTFGAAAAAAAQGATGGPFEFSDPFSNTTAANTATTSQNPQRQQTEYGFGTNEFAAQGFEGMQAGAYPVDAYGYNAGMMMMDMTNAIHPNLAQRASLGARRASSAQAMLESWTAYADYEHSPSGASPSANSTNAAAASSPAANEQTTAIAAPTPEKLPEVRAELFNDAFSFSSGASSSMVSPALSHKTAHHSRTSSLAVSDARTHVSPIEQPVALAAESPYLLGETIALELGHDQQQQQHWDVSSDSLSYPC